MLTEVFYWLLNMSILGGFTGLIIALIRRTPRLPRFAAYVMWIVPMIRLCIPFGLSSQWSVFSLISRVTTKTVVIPGTVSGTPALSMTNSFQAAESYFPIVYKTDLLRRIFEVSSVIWAIIAAAAVLTAVVLYTVTKRELRDAGHLYDNVWQSAKITTPAVYGIFHPKIILPEKISDQDLPFILMHENIHIRRRDNLWRVIAVMTACIHWFNPLIWIFLKWFLTDMELACDSKVLRMAGTENAKSYASALLNCASGKNYFASAFGATRTRVRIEHILSYKKLTLLSSVACGILLAAVAFVLITNAVGG